MPTDQQAALRNAVRQLIQTRGMTVRGLVVKAGLSPQTLYNWFNGSDALGELAVSKVGRVLGADIEHLFYNSPSEQPADEATPPDEAGKARAIREIQQLIDSVDDPAERLRIINIVRATLRAAVDEYARDAGAGGDAPRAARRAAGRGRKGAEGGPVG